MLESVAVGVALGIVTMFAIGVTILVWVDVVKAFTENKTRR